MLKRSIGSLLILGAGLTFSGCETYTQKSNVRDREVRGGSIQLAAVMATRDAEKNKDGKDAVVYQLENGATHRLASLAGVSFPAELKAPTKESHPSAPESPPSPPNAESPTEPAPPAATPGAAEPVPSLPDHIVWLRRSLAAFDAAEAKVNEYEAQAKVKIGSTAASILTNQAAVPYRGRSYDKIMMNTYKALNYIQLGEFDAARVELNRALQRQRDAVAENTRRIEEAQQVALEAKEGKAVNEEGKATQYDVARAQSDPKTETQLAMVEAGLDIRIKPYGDYVNPFSVFLDGLFFLTRAENGADLERARVSIQRVAGMVPENPYAAIDAEMAEAAANGQIPSGLTYVIFETGSAPYRDETRIEIPTFLVTDKVAYIGAVFPKLRFDNSDLPALSVTAGNQTLESSLLCSMDSVIAVDFKNEWPSIVTKTLISTAAKAVVDGVVQKQAGDKLGMMGGLVAKVTSTAVQSTLNIADTRTWRTLPREFHYLRFVTPEDRKLILRVGEKGDEQPLEVSPGKINVIYAKRQESNSPLLVSQFVLVP